MRRRLVIVGCLVFLIASAGCTSMLGVDGNPGQSSGLGLGLGLGGEKPTNNANGNGSTQYTWNTSADATLTLDTDQYRSVYKLDQRKLTVYTHGSFGQEQSVELKAVKYRYPNGTVIALDEKKSFNIDKSRKRTTIHVPNSNGSVAFVTEKSGRSISVPVFLEPGKLDGPSYEIILPPNTGVSVPFLSSIHPGGYETKSIDGRIHVTWESVESKSISARYYLNQDLLIFSSIASLLIVIGLIGAVYYLVQIRKLAQLRKNVGFDIDAKDD